MTEWVTGLSKESVSSLAWASAWVMGLEKESALVTAWAMGSACESA